LAGMIALAAAPSSGGHYLENAKLSPSHSPPQWMVLGDGILFSMISANRYCRKGEPDVAVIRIEPAAVKVQARHFRAHGAEEPMTAVQWQRMTGSMVIFNGSQYYPDLIPMGWFIQDGKNFGTSAIKGWKGLLAAHPTQEGLPPVTVIDMDEHPYSLESLPYTVAVQSLMLFDAQGNLRTRKSDWVANRTVVAEDRQGRILVICTEGGYTLWEMAMLLQEGTLDIHRAMVMDGGYETQMAVRAESFSYSLRGQWSMGDAGDWSIPVIHRSLPAVISVDPVVKEASNQSSH
jgi:uncharacterized protein YigE (DUF2233 family)